MRILSLLLFFKGCINRKLYWLALLGVLLLIWELFAMGLRELTVIPLLYMKISGQYFSPTSMSITALTWPPT